MADGCEARTARVYFGTRGGASEEITNEKKEVTTLRKNAFYPVPPPSAVRVEAPAWRAPRRLELSLDYQRNTSLSNAMSAPWHCRSLFARRSRGRLARASSVPHVYTLAAMHLLDRLWSRHFARPLPIIVMGHAYSSAELIRVQRIRQLRGAGHNC